MFVYIINIFLYTNIINCSILDNVFGIELQIFLQRRNIMDYTKENMKNYKKFDDSLFWVIGTVLTAILPYIVMLIGWIAGECSESFWTYSIGIADSAAFMYSVSLCLFLLCIDFDKYIEKKVRSICTFISVFFVISSALLYGAKTIPEVQKKIELEKMIHNENEELMLKFIQQNVNTNLSHYNIISSLVILVISIVFVCIGCYIIKKHDTISEKAKSEDEDNGQECKQVDMETVNQENNAIREQQDTEANTKYNDRKNEGAKNESKKKNKKKK